jgi:hypothetical protein
MSDIDSSQIRTEPGGYLSLHEMSAIILAKEGDTTPATSDEPDALVGTLCQRFADAAGLDNRCARKSRPQTA